MQVGQRIVWRIKERWMPSGACPACQVRECAYLRGNPHLGSDVVAELPDHHLPLLEAVPAAGHRHGGGVLVVPLLRLCQRLLQLNPLDLPVLNAAHTATVELRKEF
jgi:hypothetical protein